MALREGLLDVAHPTFVAMTSPLACGMTCKCHRLIPSLSRKHVYSQLLPSCAFGYSPFSFSFLQEPWTREVPAGTLDVAATSEV